MNPVPNTGPGQPEQPERLDAAALKDLLAGGQADTEGTAREPWVIDVRTTREFAAAHIPGSHNVPLDMVREHRDELRHHLDDDVVLVCRGGARAEQAAAVLAAAGLSKLRVLDGGILAWQAADGPVRHGRKHWELERQVRLVAGSIVVAGVVGSVVFPPLKWVAGAIGTGLTVAALSNTCAMGMLLAKLPYNRGARCDIDTVLAPLRADAAV